MEIALISGIAMIAMGLFVWAFTSSLIIIQEYETGVYMRLGRFVKNLKPGVHFVAPFISRVYRVDTRILTIDLGRKEVMTKDMSPTVIEAMVQYRIEEPQKSMFGYEKYKHTISHISHVTLRKIALQYDLMTLIRNQNGVNSRLKAALEKEFKPMGILIHRTEIREIEPVGPVKAAMEERLAAEREREAIILRADGRRRARMLESEGRPRV